MINASLARSAPPAAPIETVPDAALLLIVAMDL
jgi:hypothetical protein